ncbi:hypothetical protein KEM48_013044 [Puccinia striiformis f. sp. tritici PST-130]|uniref:F-box domain-containing protein n=1 Tax=Puccinia striiformis f. sp. tritici PST-78 TaxID=1165861 RepID=A0A0L0VVZ1_9BASI|nr:hypothetical protein KEM48_013044 [Puccinia striiformis f. sp. tritici PST-130]KNF03165.1 hypothetical protein PSTG_03752 [Puccinia striiformis f. sp. tritici PST-78]
MHPLSTSATPSLSRLPTEINKLIVECVAPLTEKRVYTEAPRFLELAFVDRTFYELSSLTNWNELDPATDGKTCLDGLINGILPRQAARVQSISIGGHCDDLNNPTGEWQFPEVQLRRILEICSNLNRLTVGLESASLDKLGNFIIDPLRPISKLLTPISQLSNLTYIRLNNDANCLFEEDAIAKLIEKMVHLAHIGLRVVSACYPTCDLCECPKSDQPMLSPLAVQLPKLPSLKVIDFDHEESFDSGWSKIEWNGALEEIILHNCMNVSLGAVHAFCKLFKDSLVHLSMYWVPISCRDNYDLLPKSDLQYTFFLPKLERLSIFTLYPPHFWQLS